MAFPITRSARAGVQTTNADPWTLTYPDSGDILDGGSNPIVAGDLILINIARDGSAGTGSITGYTKLYDQPAAANAARGLTFVKVATGSESGTFTYTVGASEQGCWRIAVIKNWYGAISGGVEAGGTATGTSLYPDPDNMTPSWGAKDTYWRAVCSTDDGRNTFTGFPTNYTIYQNADESGGSGGASMGSAGRQYNAASDNPSQFTGDLSQEWLAWVVAVRPSAAETKTKTYSLSARLFSRLTKIYSLAVRLRKTQIKSYTLSARLYKQPTATYTLSARLLNRKTRTYTISTRLFKLKTKDYTVSARLFKTATKDYSLSARLVTRKTSTYTLSARLKRTQTVAYTLATRLVHRLSVSYTLSARLLQRFTKSYTLATRLYQRLTKTYTLSARLIKSQTKSYTLSARLVIRKLKDYTVATLLVHRLTQSYTIAARLIKRNTKTYNLTARLLSRLTHSYTLAARLVKRPTKSYTLSATLFTRRMKTYSLAAKLTSGAPVTKIKSYTLSVILFKPQPPIQVVRPKYPIIICIGGACVSIKISNPRVKIIQCLELLDTAYQKYL